MEAFNPKPQIVEYKMRMWMVDPKIMCNKHLLGEHVELHMFVGTLKKKKSIQGYINNNFLEPLSILDRHTALSVEMTDRGMNHKSPIDENLDNILNYLNIEIINYKINKDKSLEDLISRCPICKSKYEKLEK